VRFEFFEGTTVKITELRILEVDTEFWRW